MQADGADDIGGELRALVRITLEEEEPTAPVIETLRQTKTCAPISIDTRKMAVAHAALNAGAAIVNDVSGLTFDEHMADLVANRGVPVCVMHLKRCSRRCRTPDTAMFCWMCMIFWQVIDRLVDMGVTRDQIIVDPGIGFGKTQAHNLALLQGLSLFTVWAARYCSACRANGLSAISVRSHRQTPLVPRVNRVGLAGLAQGVQIRVCMTYAKRAGGAIVASGALVRI